MEKDICGCMDGCWSYVCMYVYGGRNSQLYGVNIDSLWQVYLFTYSVINLI